MKVLLAAIYPYAFSLLVFIVPFDQYVRAWPNILMGILAVTFPFILSRQDVKKIDKKSLTVLLLFFLLLLLNTLFFQDWNTNGFIIEKIGISLAIFILYLPINNHNLLRNSIIFSSIVAVLYSLFNVFMLVKATGTFEFANNSNPVEALLIDRLYLGLLSVISIIISYINIKPTFDKYNKYYLANIALQVAFLFLIAARIAIFTTIILYLLWFFYHKASLKAWMLNIASILLVVIFAFSVNSNLSDRFFYQTEYNSNKSLIQKTLDREPRAVIWQCAYNLAVQDNPLFFGRGFKNLKNDLVSCYASADINKQRSKWMVKEGFNSHNQFIDFYLGGGVILLLLFVLFFAFLLGKHFKDYQSLAFIISFILFMMVENIFHRQIGAYYFGVFLIYILLNKTNEESNHKIKAKHNP